MADIMHKTSGMYKFSAHFRSVFFFTALLHVLPFEIPFGADSESVEGNLRLVKSMPMFTMWAAANMFASTNIKTLFTALLPLIGP